MKTLGLIGGMSWESTVPYYSIINEQVRDALGGLHSAKILLYSVDFAEIEKMMTAGDWNGCTELLINAASGLEQAGAGLILICTNTLHKVYDAVQEKLHVPLLHIADAAADALLRDNVKKAALLGTRYTVKEAFYRDRLEEQGLTVLIPDEQDVNTVDRIIFDELCEGKMLEASRDELLRVIGKMKARGAEAVILGCTELGLMVTDADSPLPVYDTTVIHAKRAARLALQEE